MRNILVGLPSVIFSLLAAGYFSVYRVINSADSDGALPDWQTIIFIDIPNFVTATVLTQFAVAVLLAAALVGLTAEAYKLGSKESGLYLDKILIGVAVIIALAIFIIMRSAFDLN